MDANRSTRTPWIMVTAVIVAAVLLGIAIIVGDPVLIIVAVAVVVTAGLGVTVMSRKGGAPISFSEEFPENTIGPRATTGGDSSPPIDTRPHPDPTPQADAISEVAASDSPEPPDDERVFPQYVNLPPGDRLRREHGETYIEKERRAVPEDDGEEH
jgi:hypothetical protein